MKKINRRQFMSNTAAALSLISMSKFSFAEQQKKPKIRISMYDASMGCKANIKAFETARQIGLDGVQINVVSDQNLAITICNPNLQNSYKKEAKKHGIKINSIAMGICNNIPIKSEPISAVWVADTLEIAKNLGASNVMIACFGKGEINHENEDEIRRVTEALKALAPRAEKAGVIIGLESTLDAENHLRIIDKVDSPYVQVYYDVFNMVDKGRDPIKEIKMIGKKKICEIHCKEGSSYLGQSGKIDWKAVADTLKEIGYENWLTLETSNPTKNVIADSRKNTQFLRKLLQ